MTVWMRFFHDFNLPVHVTWKNRSSWVVLRAPDCPQWGAGPAGGVPTFPSWLYHSSSSPCLLPHCLCLRCCTYLLMTAMMAFLKCGCMGLRCGLSSPWRGTPERLLAGVFTKCTERPALAFFVLGPPHLEGAA